MYRQLPLWNSQRPLQNIQILLRNSTTQSTRLPTETDRERKLSFFSGRLRVWGWTRRPSTWSPGGVSMYNRSGDRSAAVTTDDASTIQEVGFLKRGRRPSRPQNPQLSLHTLPNWYRSGNGAEHTSAAPHALGFAATKFICNPIWTWWKN